MVVIAAAILIVSVFFPSVYKGLTSGSFGKADKYHQDQMSDKDVQLRSEFTKDTAQLRQMVTGLIYFTLFTDNLSMTIDTCITYYKAQGFEKIPMNSEAVKLLVDFNDYLKNNNKTLANTTRLLTDLLLDDTSSPVGDIDQNIREFANYVYQVNRRDSVLMNSITKMDNYLLGNKLLQKQQEQIRELKAIRDRLVITSTQFMALTGNKKGVGTMLTYAVRSQAQLSGIGPLCVVQDGAAASLSSGKNLNVLELSSATSLSAIFPAVTLQGGVSEAKIIVGSQLGYGILYDKSKLSFIIGSAEEIKSVYGSSAYNAALCGTNTNLGYFSQVKGGDLGVVLNAGILCGVLQCAPLCAALSASQLNIIIPAQALASAGGGQLGILYCSPIGSMNNVALQKIILGSTNLQKILSNEGALNGFNDLRSTSVGIFPPPP